MANSPQSSAAAIGTPTPQPVDRRQKVLSDPNFFALPEDAQDYVLSKVDPTFQKLSPDAKKYVLFMRRNALRDQPRAAKPTGEAKPQAAAPPEPWYQRAWDFAVEGPKAPAPAPVPTASPAAPIQPVAAHVPEVPKPLPAPPKEPWYQRAGDVVTNLPKTSLPPPKLAGAAALLPDEDAVKYGLLDPKEARYRLLRSQGYDPGVAAHLSGLDKAAWYESPIVPAQVADYALQAAVPGWVGVRAQAKQVTKDSHPLLRIFAGLTEAPAEVVSSMSTPENLALLAGLFMYPEKQVPRLVTIVINAGFSTTQARQAGEDLSAGIEAAKQGKWDDAGRLLGSSAVSGFFAFLGAHKAADVVREARVAADRIAAGRRRGVAWNRAPKGLPPAPGEPAPAPTTAEAPPEAPTPTPPAKQERPEAPGGPNVPPGAPAPRPGYLPEEPVFELTPRIDLETRHEVQDFMNQSGYSREDALRAVAAVRLVGDRVPTEEEEKQIDAIVAGEAKMPPKVEQPPLLGKGKKTVPEKPEAKPREQAIEGRVTPPPEPTAGGEVPQVEAPKPQVAPATPQAAPPSAVLHKPEYLKPGTAVLLTRPEGPMAANVRKVSDDGKQVTIKLSKEARAITVPVEEVTPAWGVPLSEFLKAQGATGNAHQMSVSMAQRDALPVPANVLADYPGMKVAAAAPLPATEPKEVEATTPQPPPEPLAGHPVGYPLEAPPEPVAETPKPAKRGKPPKVTELTPSEFFKVGRVRWDHYWQHWNKILAFNPTGRGGWSATEITSDANGNPVPGEQPRTHSTMPDRRDLPKTLENDARLAKEAKPAPEPTSEITWKKAKIIPTRQGIVAVPIEAPEPSVATVLSFPAEVSEKMIIEAARMPFQKLVEDDAHLRPLMMWNYARKGNRLMWRRLKDGDNVPLNEVSEAQDAVKKQFGITDVSAAPEPISDKPFKYSSTQLNLSANRAESIRTFARNFIDEADLAGKGLEGDPHITARWGLHTEDVEEVRKIVEGEAPIRVTYGKTGVFPASKSSEGNEVVYLEVKSPDLETLNDKLAGLAHTDTHGEFRPHVTLGYVEATRGAKYAGDATFEGSTVRFDTLTFSDRSGKEVGIRLKGERPTLSWQYGIKTHGDLDWGKNATYFATKEEAEQAAHELMSRWFAVTDTKVFPDDENKPNYRFNSDSYRAEPLEKTEAAPQPSPKDFASTPEELAKLNKLRRLLGKPELPSKQQGLDPEIIVAAAEYGEELYKKGFTDFAKWSNQMVSAVGDEVRPFLDAAWDRVEAMYGGEEPEAPAPPEKPVESGIGEQERVKKLTKAFANKIKQGDFPLGGTWTDLAALAKSLVGGDPGEYIDDLYDAVEGAFNWIRIQQAREAGITGLGAKVERANAYEDELPKRTKRTLEIMELQQFSTPFPLSEGVMYAGDVKHGNVVMEPNAGTGNLVAPLLADSRITVKANEIDPRRAAVLDAIQFPDVTVNDYLQLEGRKADVILMNPPWGAASTGRYGHLNIPSPWGPLFHDISERFFVKALRDLEDGGRVSALMPTTILKAAGFMKWLRDNHTLRALLASPPWAYERRGTSVGSILLVVDKGKFAEEKEPIVRTLTNAPQTWDDWVAALKPLSEGGSHARSEAAPLGAGRPTQPGLGAVSPPAAGGGVAGRPSGRPGAAGISGPGEPGAPAVAAGERKVEPIGEAVLVRRTPEALLPFLDNLAPDRRREYEDAQRSSIFIPYVPRQSYRNAPDAQLHPRQVIETRSLAGVPYPELKVELGPTLAEALDQGRISVEQADAISAVLQANHRGHSMLISDDVGVGKSREALGTAIEWIERKMAGEKGKVLYISAGETNLRDVEIELRLLLGLDAESGKPPYDIIYVRDYPKSKERPDKPWEPLPDRRNALYMIEAHNLVPFSKAIKEGGFGGVIADECFPYESIVTTDRGKLPIGRIVEEKLIVSVLSVSSSGENEWKPISRWIKKRRNEKLVRVTHERGSFVCTIGERVWTTDGYKEANSLCGSYLRLVPKEIYGGEEWQDNTQILQPLMRNLRKDVAARGKRSSARNNIGLEVNTQDKEEAGDNSYQNLSAMPSTVSGIPDSQEADILFCELRFDLSGEPFWGEGGVCCSNAQSQQGENQSRSVHCFVAENENEQSNEEPSNGRKGPGEIERPYLLITRWSSKDYARAGYRRGSDGMGYRSCDSDEASVWPISIIASVLPSGYWEQGDKTSRGDRRADASAQKVEVSGCEKDRSFESSRVVGVEVLESRSERESSGYPEPDWVYDIEVESNHNFFADDVLVSNCHKLRNVVDAQRGMTWKDLNNLWLEQGIPIGVFTATPAQTIDAVEYLYPLREWTTDGFDDFIDRVKGRLTAEQVQQRQEKQQRERRADRKALEYIHSLDPAEKGELAGLYYRGLLGNLTPPDFMRFQVLQRQFPPTVLEPLDAIYQEGYRKPPTLAQPGALGVGTEGHHVQERRLGRDRGDVFRRDVSTAELEQIMRELKMTGKYRSVDIWRGGLEFNEFPSELTPKEIKDWSTAVNFIRECMKYAEQFRPMTHRKMNPGLIASQAQFAIKRFLFNFRLKRALPLAEELLKSGHQVIFATEFVSETDPTRGNIGAILGQINTQQDDVNEETGEITNIGDIPEALLIVNELRERAPREFPQMPSPIDEIKQAFGEENVADLSGQVPMEKRRKAMADFQGGIRTIAIMSPAASTGINLHHVTWTDKGPAKGRRGIIMMDYKWNAEDMKQGTLGRADRSGQLSIPTIFMQTLGMAAERKFIATLANRLKDVGAIAKGAAESVGAQPLLDFEVGGNIDLLAMRDMWYKDYISDDDKLWFRGKKFIEAQRFGDEVIYKPLYDIRGANLKDFMLQLQLMPLDVGNRAFEAYTKRREELYAEESEDENIVSETQKGDGAVTRVRQLQPNLSMYEVKDKDNHRYGILTGMITDKAALIRPMLPQKGRFIYLTFRDQNGEPISGLRIPFEMIPIVTKRLGAKELLKHTPESAMDDMIAGDTITLANGWKLYLGRAGSRKGKIIIDGAGLTNTERGALVIPHGGAYNPAANFFVVKEDRLQDFLKRFPIAAELSKEAEGPEGEAEGGEDDTGYQRIWMSEPSPDEIKKRMPGAEGISDQEATAMWRRAATSWVRMTEAATPQGDPYHIFNEGNVMPREEVEKIAKDPRWGEIGAAIRSAVQDIAELHLPQGTKITRTGIFFPQAVGGAKEQPLTFGVNTVDPVGTNASGVFVNILAYLDAMKNYPDVLTAKDASDLARFVNKTLKHEVAHALYRGHKLPFWKFYGSMLTQDEETIARDRVREERLARALSGGEPNGQPGEFLTEGYRKYLEARGKGKGAVLARGGISSLQVRLPEKPNRQGDVGVGGTAPPGGGEGARPEVSGRPAPEPTAGGEPGSGALRTSVMGLDEAARLAQRLYDINIKQHVVSLGGTFADALRRMAEVAAPRMMAPKTSVNIIMRAKGLPDLTLMKLGLIDRGMRRMFDSLPTKANIAFIDRFKRGEKQPNPELQKVADFIKSVGDAWYKAAIWEQIQDYHPPLSPVQQKQTYQWAVNNLERIGPLAFGEEQPRNATEKVMAERFSHMTPYLENHLRVFWETLPGSGKQGFPSIWNALLGRRRLQGSKGWMKQHTLPDMSAGIELGGKPVTYNPMTLTVMDARDHARFVAARRAFRQLRRSGVVRFFRKNQYKGEEGFEGKIDDPITDVYFKVAEGLVDAGEWRTDPNTARLFNNYLSRDYFKEVPILRSLLWLKKATTMWELGLSLFHGTFETIMAMGVHSGVGIARMVNLGLIGKKPKEFALGLGEVLGSPLAPARYLAEGRAIIRYMRSKQDFEKIPGANLILKEYPQIDQFIEKVLGEGGGMIRMHEDYRMSARKGFLQAAKDWDIVGAAASSIPNLMQAIMTPLFDYVIPAYKLAYEAQLYFEQLAEKEQDILEGRITETELARRVVDQSDNLFGEMSWDNLFWHNTVKSLAQLLFRSVTWYWGSVRTPLVAAKEQATEFGRMVEKRRTALPSSTTDDPLRTGAKYRTDYNFRIPRISPSLAAIFGIMLNTALVSIVYMRLKRKDHAMPKDWDWKDLVAPRSGEIDDLGHEERARFPSEFWTLRGLLTHPGQTVKAAESGFITRLGEAIANRDFFGEYVYDPKANVVKEAIEILGHIAGEPLSVSVYQQAKEEGKTPTERLFAFFGMRKAPLNFDLAQDETLALEFLKRRGEREPLSYEQAETRKQVKRVAHGFREDKLSEWDVGEMVRRGQITYDEGRSILLSAKKPWIYRLFRLLHPAEKITVFEAASPEHKKDLVELLHLTRNDYKENLPADLKVWDDEMQRLREGQTAKPAPAPEPSYLPGILREARPAPQPST